MNRRGDQPGPAVTVHDPTAPARQAPVPADRPRRPRRGLGVLLVMVGVLAGVRSLAASSGAPSPRLQLDGTAAVYLGLSRTADGLRIQVPFRLDNTGHAGVTVVSASITGSLLATTGPAWRIAAGASRQLLLEQRIVCPPGRPPPAATSTSVMRVRLLIDDAERTVVLRLPPEPRQSVLAELFRQCGYVPVPEAVRLVAGPGRRERRVLLVPLTVLNASAQAVRVSGLASPAASLAVGLQGGPAGLPIEVAAATGPRPLPGVPPTARHLLLALTLAPTACSGREPPSAPGTLALLTVDRGPGTPASVLHLYDDGLALGRLYADGCG